YNPDRVTDPMARSANGQWRKLSWDEGLGRLQAKVKEARGKGIAFVTGLESGSFGDLVDAWTRQVGGRHVTYEPFAFEALRAGDRGRARARDGARDRRPPPRPAARGRGTRAGRARCPRPRTGRGGDWDRGQGDHAPRPRVRRVAGRPRRGRRDRGPVPQWCGD